MIIGVDPHKGSHTATALDAVTNTSVASVRVDASIGGYRQLLRWARQFGERRWAVENARGLGCHLAQWLVAPDEVVLDASTAATARVRELSRGGRRKRRCDRRCCGRECCSAPGRRFGSRCRGHNSGVCPVGRAEGEPGRSAGPLSQPAPRLVERLDSRWCTDGAQGQHSCDASPQRSAPKTADGPVEAIRMLRVVRRSAIKARTQAANQIHALVVTAPEPVKAQLKGKNLKARVKICVRFRPGTDHTTTAHAKRALRYLARRYQTLTAEIDELDTQIRPSLRTGKPGAAGHQRRRS